MVWVALWELNASISRIFLTEMRELKGATLEDYLATFTMGEHNEKALPLNQKPDPYQAYNILKS